MTKKKLIVVGAGGFAREVRWLAQDISSSSNNGDCYEFQGFVVSDISSIGEHDSGDDVIGDLQWLKANSERFDYLAIGVGSPQTRIAIIKELEDDFGPAYWPSLIHPSSHYDKSTCTVSHGVLICANVIGTVGIEFQPFAMVNLGCTIGHEAIIGRASTLNPCVNISGGVTIGEGVLVGTGAQILQYLDLGTSSTVGSGAVVTKSVSAGSTVVGIPAKSIR